jgi:hypothetical protein
MSTSNDNGNVVVASHNSVILPQPSGFVVCAVSSRSVAEDHGASREDTAGDSMGFIEHTSEEGPLDEEETSDVESTTDTAIAPLGSAIVEAVSATLGTDQGSMEDHIQLEMALHESMVPTDAEPLDVQLIQVCSALSRDILLEMPFSAASDKTVLDLKTMLRDVTNTPVCFQSLLVPNSTSTLDNQIRLQDMSLPPDSDGTTLVILLVILDADFVRDSYILADTLAGAGDEMSPWENMSLPSSHSDFRYLNFRSRSETP